MELIRSLIFGISTISYMLIIGTFSESSGRISLTKCCVNGQIFDVYSNSCVDWIVKNLENSSHAYPLDPAILTPEAYDETYHQDPKENDYNSTSMCYFHCFQYAWGCSSYIDACLTSPKVYNF